MKVEHTPEAVNLVAESAIEEGVLHLVQACIFDSYDETKQLTPSAKMADDKTLVIWKF